MENSLNVPLEGYEDVTPIPQDDGPSPVVPIAYPHDCESKVTDRNCSDILSFLYPLPKS